MTKEELGNKIITVDKILEVAEYLEKQKAHYKKIYKYNDKLNYYTKDDINVFKGTVNKIDYHISLKSGESVEKEDFEWFKNQLINQPTAIIEKIWISFSSWSSSNLKGKSEISYESLHRRIDVNINMYEDSVKYGVEGENFDDETYQIKNDIDNMLRSCPVRYDKTIKRRFLRDEALSLTIGFIVGYIVLLAGFFCKDNLPEAFFNIMEKSKYSYIILFYLVAIGVGNIIGKIISIGMYKKIAPKKKYSHYSKSSKSSVYVNNIEEYIKENEVQIGCNHDTVKIRNKIEKIFGITGLIVLVHIVVTTIVCIMMK